MLKIPLITLCHTLMAMALLLIVIKAQQSIDPVPVADIQKPTIVESNHYYSSKEKSVNYNVVSLNKNLPIMIIPKNANKTRASYKNKINITLNDNQGNYISCLYDDNFQLCVLEKFVSQNVNMIIQCQTLPCQFSWLLIQSPIQKINTSTPQKTSLKQLYEVQQSSQNRHQTLKVTCDNPQLQSDFHHELQFYANRQNYHHLKTEGITYYLFNNPPTSFKEYFFIKINEKYRTCAKIQIKNQQASISVDQQINDFVLKGSNVTYNVPAQVKNLQVSSIIHLFSQKQDFSGNFSVKLTGSIGGTQQTLRKMNIQTKTKRVIEFSFVLNNITESHSNLQLVFESSKLDCILKFQLLAANTQKIEKGQYSFFSLRKGEKVNYQIVQNTGAQKGDKAYIFPSDEKIVKLSKHECQSKQGCQFQLQVSQDTDGSIYIGQSKKQNTEEVVKFAIDKSYTKRVKEGSIVYLKKKVQQKKSYQVVVNTHNVLLYAASEQKCALPHDKCHEKVGNSHNPFIYESQKSGNLIISVFALDSSEFTVTIIEESGQYPELKDGVPFSYLLDHDEDEIVFKFNLDEKEDLTFSLIAPLNELELHVFQQKELPKSYAGQSQLFTSDGTISLKKSQIKSKDFIVLVKKLQSGNQKFVHFTLIASTKNVNIKLQAGVTHLQKLIQNQHQDFVLQFDPTKKYVVSFYAHDLVGQKINISLELSKNDTYTKENEHKYEIDHSVDEIDISQEGQKVCESEGTKFCEVFLRVTNKMDKKVSLQITLLSTNSIVQIHDGLWQFFPEELTSTTIHFYFFPKHLNNPVSILYQSNNPDLRIFYSLTKMDVETINPQLWSYPTISSQSALKQSLHLNHRQVQSISIGKQALASCEPNCLVLMTLAKSNGVQGQFDEVDREKQFGIMVSNSMIDIPEKTRVDVSLQKGQTKYLKMNVANVLQHDTLTCYIYTSLGFVSVYANVCSEKSMKMPTNEQFDFSFGILETQLRSETIRKKYDANDIDENANPFLCLVAVSQENSKFSIEYTSEQEIVNLLRLDEYKTVGLQNKPKYFQIEASVEHTVKIVRNKGYPYIQEVKCTGKDISYEECLQDFQESKEKSLTSQMVDKIKRYQYTPCEKCIVYLKLYSEESAEVSIHLESKYTEITLEQKKIVTDYLEKNQENRYEVTALTNEPAYITVNVINGDVKCKVTDLNEINVQKSSDSKQRVIHISISSNQLAQAKIDKSSNRENKNLFNSFFSGFGLSKLFATLHISIQSTDPEKAASYTIQYSSGQRQSYLQDGLVSHYKLEANTPKVAAKFYYQNFFENSHVYMFLGASNSKALSSLEINIYSMEKENDQDSKQQINSKIPQLRKKTTKPTVLYPLPTAKFYQIQVFNPTGEEVVLSIGVNHQQVAFIPYDIEYPFPLANKQFMNFIVDVQNKGYVLLTLKKCDQSSVQISYTLDYEGFQKEQYQYTTTLQNEPKFEELIKIKSPGPLYINLKRNQLEDFSSDTQYKNSVFSLNAKFSTERVKTSDFTKPGNKGLINYELLGDGKVKIQFSQVTCEAKNNFCGTGFEYFLVSSDKMVDVYSQSVCPTTFFADVQSKEKHNVLPLRKILQKPDSDRRITFEYKFQKSSSIEYIAIKAVFKNKENDTIEVYYQPIQVATIWGQIQKASSKFGRRFGIGIGAFVTVCLCLICIRRKTRKGYSSLEESD